VCRCPKIDSNFNRWCIGVLASSVIDLCFKEWSGQTKDYIQIGIRCFSDMYVKPKTIYKLVFGASLTCTSNQRLYTNWYSVLLWHVRQTKDYIQIGIRCFSDTYVKPKTIYKLVFGASLTCMQHLGVRWKPREEILNIDGQQFHKY
jgi:hypothetical protein